MFIPMAQPICDTVSVSLLCSSVIMSDVVIEMHNTPWCYTLSLQKAQPSL